MPMIQGNMNDVQKWGEVVPEGWYKVHVEKGTMETSKESGQPSYKIVMKVQTEPHVGKAITDFISLQSHALAKLKAYYEAVGYTPGPEGHDPDTLIGKDLFVKVEHEVYKGDTRAKVAPWNIRSLNEGPGA